MIKKLIKSMLCFFMLLGFGMETIDIRANEIMPAAAVTTKHYDFSAQSGNYTYEDYNARITYKVSCSITYTKNLSTGEITYIEARPATLTIVSNNDSNLSANIYSTTPSCSGNTATVKVKVQFKYNGFSIGMITHTFTLTD